MKLQQLLSLTRKAVDTYHLIDEGDHIAIGLSGGKDSLALLYALHGLQRFYPKKFSLTAVSVDLGMEGFDLTPVTKMSLIDHGHHHCLNKIIFVVGVSYFVTPQFFDSII